MSNDLVPTPMMLLDKALSSGVDVEKLKSLFDLQERWERNEAAKVFAESIRKFQSLCPAIEKRNPVYGKNRDLGPQYHYAGLEDIMEVAQPFLDQCGIAPTFTTTFDLGLMKTICRIRVGIHSEETEVTLGVPQIPNASDAQKAGGALKYGMRYALVAALNIRVKGEDNDAQDLDAQVISEAEIKLLKASISETTVLCGVAVDINALLKFANPSAKSIESLNREQYLRCMNDLGFRRQKAQQKGK